MSVEAGRRRLGGSGGVGAPLDRVDGYLKVTGGARYAAEHPIEGLAHAVLVQSTIARGRIARLDTAAAEAAPGVLAVISHLNAPKLPPMKSFLTGEGVAMQTAPVLQDDVIHHAGQHLAVVVAETLEQAQYAAQLVRIAYEQLPPRAEPSKLFEQIRQKYYREFAERKQTPGKQERADRIRELRDQIHAEFLPEGREPEYKPEQVAASMQR